MRSARQKIDDEEKNYARDQIDAQRMNVAGALALHELVRQPPRLEKEEAEGLKEAGVEIEKGVGRIDQE